MDHFTVFNLQKGVKDDRVLSLCLGGAAPPSGPQHQGSSASGTDSVTFLSNGPALIFADLELPIWKWLGIKNSSVRGILSS